MTATVWVGVDPGYNATGLVIRRGLKLLAFRYVTRDTDEAIVAGDQGIAVGPTYLRAVKSTVLEYLALAATLVPGAIVRCAVEDITAPSVHMKLKDGATQRRITPRYAMGAAKVVAVVEVAVDEHPTVELVRVRAGHHGRNLLAAYPAALVTAAERRHRGGLNRPAAHNADVNHCRSAWDVAGGGATADRLAIALDITRAAIARGAQKK